MHHPRKTWVLDQEIHCLLILEITCNTSYLLPSLEERVFNMALITQVYGSGKSRTGVRCSRTVQCRTVYPSDRPDLQIRIHHWYMGVVWEACCPVSSGFRQPPLNSNRDKEFLGLVSIQTSTSSNLSSLITKNFCIVFCSPANFLFENFPLLHILLFYIALLKQNISYESSGIISSMTHTLQNYCTGILLVQQNTFTTCNDLSLWDTKHNGQVSCSSIHT